MDARNFREIVLVVVPAVIALAIVATVIVLSIWTDKETPPVLVNSMTTILGFYFGMAVKAGLSSKGDE